jgi:hypothetical protein
VTAGSMKCEIVSRSTVLCVNPPARSKGEIYAHTSTRGLRKAGGSKPETSGALLLHWRRSKRVSNTSVDSAGQDCEIWLYPSRRHLC